MKVVLNKKVVLFDNIPNSESLSLTGLLNGFKILMRSILSNPMWKKCDIETLFNSK